jgi:hypothetical protein
MGCSTGFKIYFDRYLNRCAYIASASGVCDFLHRYAKGRDRFARQDRSEDIFCSVLVKCDTVCRL